MNLSSKRRKVVKVETSSLGELYPHNLQMYISPPSIDITLTQVEELAVERLKVLRCFELVNLKGLAKFSEDWKNALGEIMRKQGLRNIYKMLTAPVCRQTEADFQLRQRDHISHFILRLAYSSTEELRRWYIARELELFKLKFLSLNDDQILEFLRINDFNYVPITAAAKARVRDNLVASTYGVSNALIDKSDFYCVRWTEVLELVRTRKVFLEGGIAFVPSSELVAILGSRFRINLAQALTLTYRNLPNLEEDERLMPIFRNLHTSYTGDDFKTKTDGSIDIADMDKFSRTSFPLCMRQIHETFRLEHHLKYGARQQYGLFIKGTGVSLEDSLRYWREEFCKKIDMDTFEKKYSYNIRHMYGKEGKRQNYTPYNCMKIIMQSIGAGEQHGCPFKHADPNLLRNKMLNYGLSSAAVFEVMELTQKGHYHLACTKHFELTHHSQPPEQVIQHPNYYFEQSQEILSGKTVKKENTSQSQSSQRSVTSSMPVKKEPAPTATELTQEDFWGGDVDFSSLDV